MPAARREIDALTSLRFFAASLVVLEHMQMLPGLEWMGVRNGALGLAGVRIFFVLSGFIISHIYWHRDWRQDFGGNLRGFYWNRFARIYPLHWLTFLLALPLGLHSNTARVYFADFPWLLTLTDRLSPWYATIGSPPVKASWTLSCEVLFYLSTPFLFWFLTRRKNPLLASAVVFVLLSTAIFILIEAFPALNWTAYIEVPCYLFGIVGFHLMERVDFSRQASRLIVGGILLLIGGEWAGGFFPGYGMIVRFAYAPGALLLILGCATATGRVRDFLSWPFLVLLGHASYALYLLHDPALRYLKVALNRMGVVMPVPVGILTAVLVFGLLILASIACFKFYENPMRLKLRSGFKTSPAQS